LSHEGKILTAVSTKRTLDLIVALPLVFLLLPVWVLIAVVIRLESRGEIFFRQERIGLNQETFKIFKLRTMIEDAQNLGSGLFSYDNDPRITKVGQKLRLWSIDETPQLINVIQGKMSIVGPRPPVVGELEMEKNLPQGYKTRFKVMPGMTGLAQVSGRNSLNWNNKISYDLEYIEKFNKFGIIIDIWIILKSILVVFKRENVVEKETGHDQP
jgi:lipopolysaccharide/colanic/teichoic acid biosynthesis glycosyltransferase